MIRIVVGVDGSTHCHKTLDWIRVLAADAADPEIHVVHAESVAMPAQEFPFEQVEFRASLGMQLLEDAAASLKGLRVRPHLRRGPPVDALLEVADEEGADLIAVGSRGHGPGPTVRLLLGSVSNGVAHRARRSVLVVHDMAARPIRKVLVGVDATHHGVRALSAAARWAPRAALVAMHVVPTVSGGRAPFGDCDVPPDAVAERTAREVVAAAVRAAEVPSERVATLSGLGSPTEMLLMEYRSGGYDLAVVGSGGLGSITELLLGSVSERMLRLAEGPVLVAR